MTIMTIAIYAGTFDPFTLGHEDVLRRACQIFEEVIVAVAADTGRQTFFSFQERVELARAALKDVKGVRVVGFQGLDQPAPPSSSEAFAMAATLTMRPGWPALITRSIKTYKPYSFRPLMALSPFPAPLSEKFTV